MAKKKKKKAKKAHLPKRADRKRGAKLTEKNNEAIIEALKKQFGEDVVLKPQGFPIFFCDTGSWPLNWVISGRPLTGGFAGGRVTEMFGDPSTGKSVIVYKAGGLITSAFEGFFIIDDTENSYMDYYEDWFGIVPERRFHMKSWTIEEHFERVAVLYIKIREKYGFKMPILIALDSLGSLMSQAELDGDLNTSDAGRKAKMIHSAMRKLRIYLQNDPLLVYIVLNHKTVKFNDFFHPQDSSGGKGVKFQSSTRIDLLERGAVKHPKIESRIIGKNSAAKCVKSKLISPFRTCYIQIIWDDRGLIREHGVFDLLMEQLIIIKATKEDGGEKLGKYCFASDMAVEFSRKDFDASPELMKTGLEFLEAQETFRITKKSTAESEAETNTEEDNPTETDE